MFRNIYSIVNVWFSLALIAGVLVSTSVSSSFASEGEEAELSPAEFVEQQLFGLRPGEYRVNPQPEVTLVNAIRLRFDKANPEFIADVFEIVISDKIWKSPTGRWYDFSQAMLAVDFSIASSSQPEDASKAKKLFELLRQEGLDQYRELHGLPVRVPEGQSGSVRPWISSMNPTDRKSQQVSASGNDGRDVMNEGWPSDLWGTVPQENWSRFTGVYGCQGAIKKDD